MCHHPQLKFWFSSVYLFSLRTRWFICWEWCLVAIIPIGYQWLMFFWGPIQSHCGTSIPLSLPGIDHFIGIKQPFYSWAMTETVIGNFTSWIIFIFLRGKTLLCKQTRLTLNLISFSALASRVLDYRHTHNFKWRHYHWLIATTCFMKQPIVQDLDWREKWKWEAKESLFVYIFCITKTLQHLKQGPWANSSFTNHYNVSFKLVILPQPNTIKITPLKNGSTSSWMYKQNLFFPV